MYRHQLLTEMHVVLEKITPKTTCEHTMICANVVIVYNEKRTSVNSFKYCKLRDGGERHNLFLGTNSITP